MVGARRRRRTPARPARRSGTCSRSPPRSRRPAPSRSTGMAPAECARSHSIERAGALRRARQRGHVVHARRCGSSTCVSMQHRVSAVDRRADPSAGSTSRSSWPPPSRATALRDVEVGREVVGARRRSRAGRASRAPRRAALNRLTEVESATITSPGPRADQPRDLVADPPGQVDPPGAFQLPISPRAPLAARPRRPRARRVATRQRARASCRRGR